jgi:hypothetical protein
MKVRKRDCFRLINVRDLMEGMAQPVAAANMGPNFNRIGYYDELLSHVAIAIAAFFGRRQE